MHHWGIVVLTTEIKLDLSVMGRTLPTCIALDETGHPGGGVYYRSACTPVSLLGRPVEGPAM